MFNLIRKGTEGRWEVRQELVVGDTMSREEHHRHCSTAGPFQGVRPSPEDVTIDFG